MSEGDSADKNSALQLIMRQNLPLIKMHRAKRLKRNSEFRGLVCVNIPTGFSLLIKGWTLNCLPFFAVSCGKEFVQVRDDCKEDTAKFLFKFWWVSWFQLVKPILQKFLKVRIKNLNKMFRVWDKVVSGLLNKFTQPFLWSFCVCSLKCSFNKVQQSVQSPRDLSMVVRREAN